MGTGLAGGRCPVARAVMPAPGSARQALGPLAPCALPPLLTPPASRYAKPPAPGALSRWVQTCPESDSPPAPPPGAHLPAAPRTGSGSFSERMGSAGGSGPVPPAGREPRSSSPRSSLGAGGAGRLGMTRSGQLGRRAGGGSRRGSRAGPEAGQREGAGARRGAVARGSSRSRRVRSQPGGAGESGRLGADPGRTPL